MLANIRKELSAHTPFTALGTVTCCTSDIVFPLLFSKEEK